MEWTAERDEQIWADIGTRSAADVAAALALPRAAVSARLLEIARARVAGGLDVAAAARHMRVREDALARFCAAPAPAPAPTEVSNRGKPWTAEQDDALWESAHLPHAALAQRFARSAKAIQLRLVLLATKRAVDAKTAAAHLGMGEDAFAAAVASLRAPRAPRAPRAAHAAHAARSSKVQKEPPLVFTADQIIAIEAACGGADSADGADGAPWHSILLTGPAGTGKSFVVAEIAARARAAGRAVVLTSTTGTAALQIGGRTLHSFLGIGRGEGAVVAWVARAGAKARERVCAVQTLVIDEVSMLDAGFVDAASEYMSALRGDPAPFGGAQLIFVGDFCQLPPVSARSSFAFEAAAWRRLAPRVCLLTTVMRQADGEFQALLARARVGRPTAADVERLDACFATEFAAGVEPTRLCALNRDADAINQRELAAMLAAGAAPVNFDRRGRDAGWAQSMGIPDAFTACIGAQVMVTRNLRAAKAADLANGTRGVIEGVTAEAVTLRLVSGLRVDVPFVRVDEEPELAPAGEASGAAKKRGAGATFMPLQLAWAISIHKSQGATLDAVEVDLSTVFAPGQAYVALSRCRDLACLRVTSVTAGAFQCHPAVRAFYG